MSSRHYWPTEPGRYLVEKSNGEVDFATLCDNGTWQGAVYLNAFVRDLSKMGYLGVRKPFDEEAERVEFEAVFGPIGLDLTRHKNGVYIHEATWAAHKGWLAAKRHERGL